jgi:peptide/nickel transport system substrate-binding protein
MMRSRALKLILSMFTLALVVSACGGSKGGGQSSGTTTSGSNSGTTASGSHSQLTIAESSDPVSLDPLQQRVTATYSVLRNLYDPLVDFSKQGTDYTTFTPVLATSWKKLSPTALQFTLRKGVKFDDGQPFTSASVVYTVKALLGKLPHTSPSLAAFLFPSLTHAVANGPYKVTLYTKTPTQSLLASLTQLLIVPTGSGVGQSGGLTTKPDGTGPYKMTSYTPDQSIVMQANPKYFLGKAPISKLVWDTMPDSSSQLAALLSGKVNLVFGLDPSNVSTVTGHGSLKVTKVQSTRVAAIWLNTLDTPYLKNPLVRKALNYAVDKQALIKSPLDGEGSVVANVVPQYFAGYNSTPQPYPYDPTKAKALLKQAGYPNGFPLKIMVPSSHYVLGPQIVQVIASELQQVGIKATIDQVSFNTFAAVTAKRTIPAAFYGAWGSTYPDPLQMFQTIVLGGTTGFSWYDNPAVNKSINAAAVAPNETSYVSDLKQVQTQISADPPFIYLFAYDDAWGMSQDLQWTPPPTEVEYMYYARWK